MSKVQPSRGNIDYTQHTGAKGGAVLGRSRDFVKESDGADQRVGGWHVYDNPNGKEESYGKKEADTTSKGDGRCGVQNKRTGDKCLTTVKPRQ